ARALRVPHDTDAAVAGFAARLLAGPVAAHQFRDAFARHRSRRTQRLLDRYVDRVELVIARDLLGKLAAALVLEYDEVAHEVEESLPLEHAFEHDLQLRHRRRRIASPAHRPPGLEPLPARAQRADARLHAVGDHERRIGGEERWDLRLVGLELVERRPDGRVLVR